MAIYEKNQNSPIKNLPPEVFEVIFGEDDGFYWPWGRYQRLFQLRKVCKYWMEIIDSTSGLWTSIRSYLHPEVQAMIIRNSKKQPLFVQYDERIWERVSTGEEKMEAFATLMKPTTSRWQELEYY
ncbi:hypothetical protein FS837_004017, partial [Tulasnella sp. UAMH 9824]